MKEEGTWIAYRASVKCLHFEHERDVRRLVSLL